MTTLTKLNGSTSYVRMSDLKEGEVIVEKGRLVDVQAGKFGDTLIFMEEKDSKRVGLGMGGFLKSMYEKQVFKMGDTLRITYKGKKNLKMVGRLMILTSRGMKLNKSHYLATRMTLKFQNSYGYRN